MTRALKQTVIFFLLIIPHLKSHGQNSIMWRVTDTINNKSSTLLGTYHMLGNSFVDAIPNLTDQLYKVDLAIFEALDDKGKFIEIINNREDTNIKNELGKKSYYQLVEMSKDWEVDLHKLRPVELRWKLGQEYYKASCNTVNKTDRWDHMDNYLEHLAETKKIPTYGFETYEEQVKLISQNYDNPNWKYEKKQIKRYIKFILKNIKSEVDCRIANDYKNYNITYGFEEPCPDDVLIKERNSNWMQEIPRLISEKECFIAVGIKHLDYKCGLIEQLKQKGFVVEPIQLK